MPIKLGNMKTKNQLNFYKMNFHKITISFIFLIFIFIASCNDEKNNENGKGNSFENENIDLTIRSLAPPENSDVSVDDFIKVEVDYKIKEESLDLGEGFSLDLEFNANNNPSVVMDSKSFKEKSGTINLIGIVDSFDLSQLKTTSISMSISLKQKKRESFGMTFKTLKEKNWNYNKKG